MSKEALRLIAENKRTKAISLDLSFCDLKQLPSELSECVWLTELRLNDNEELSDLSSLKNLQNLQKLSVSDTQVAHFAFNQKRLKSRTGIYQLRRNAANPARMFALS
ncbi:MAG: hypothetical protein OHK0019_13030 [Saprospiraceae bacterium]